MQRGKERQGEAIRATIARSKTLPGHAKTTLRVAQHVCERVRGRADERDVDVVVHCAGNRLWVQAEAFSEALYELLVNAVEASRRGYPVIVDVRDTGQGVLWQVQDSGDGTSRGFGVAFPAAVIERLGGLLRFESAPGVGTTASIWLPGRC